MKKFLNLIISAVLILPTVTIFNDNQTKLVSMSNNDLNDLAFNIEEFHTIDQDLKSYFVLYLGTMEVVDLTTLTGIFSIEIFKKFYSDLEWPDFYAGVQLFNTTPQVHSLSISTDWLQENWLSHTMLLVEGREDIGSAAIWGSLYTRVEIRKESNFHHLLLRMHFYGSGNFESTAKHPMGEISTGWIMRLRTK